MIRWLKKNEGEETCKYLGWLLVSGLRVDRPDFLREADALVAVPSDPERTRRRGFDNIAELASWMERFAILPWEKDTLKKTVATPDLRQLSWSQRRASIRGSMQVTDNRHIENSTILLVDDVVTSGSTLDYCAELLKSAGAAKVYAAVLARSESTLASERHGQSHSVS
jgi:ComF family protein